MIKNVGILGAGSVGSALMYEMYKRDPENVYLLATGARAERLVTKGISVNNEVFFPKVYSDPSQDIHIDLLILAAKTYSMDSVIEDIGKLIDRDTILLPIENGITTTTLLREHFPENRVFYGVVLRTDAHRMSRRVYYRTLGEMQIGYEYNHEIKPEVQGVDIDEEDRDEIIEMLVNFPPDKKMSMLQDYEAGRPIEIDEYAGEVVKLGRKHGIPTPANEILYLAITARQKISELRKG